jgi:hypothetical protein
VAVIAERERFREVVGQALEPHQVRRPLGLVEPSQADAVGPPLIAKAKGERRESSRSDLVVEVVPERRDDGRGAVVRGNGHPGESIVSLLTIDGHDPQHERESRQAAKPPEEGMDLRKDFSLGGLAALLSAGHERARR